MGTQSSSATFRALWRKLGTKLKFSTTCNPQTVAEPRWWTEPREYCFGSFWKGTWKLKTSSFPILSLHTIELQIILLVNHHSRWFTAKITLVRWISYQSIKGRCILRIVKGWKRYKSFRRDYKVTSRRLMIAIKTKLTNIISKSYSNREIWDGFIWGRKDFLPNESPS